MIYFFGLLLWLELSLLFEGWAMREWQVEGALFKFLCGPTDDTAKKHG